MTKQSLVFPSMVRRGFIPRVHHADADGSAVATLDLNEAATDVCKRCSEIPWVDAPGGFEMKIFTLSPNCRICRVIDRCTPSYPEHSYYIMLYWQYAPAVIWGRLDKHKFKDIVIRVRAVGGRNNRLWDSQTIFVSTLSLEQAGMAVPLLISPVVSLSRIGDHIRDCVTNHGHTCETWEEDQKPLHLRVIDCNTRTVVDAPADCNFVALSYVWGGVCAVQEPDITQDVPLTIEHSMYVTVELGFKYLWIDRYVSAIV